MASFVFVVCNALLLLLAWRWARAYVPAADPLERALAVLAALPVWLLPWLIALGALGLLTPLATGLALAASLAAVLWHARTRLAASASSAPAGAVEEAVQPRWPSVSLGACAGVVALLAFGFLREQLLGRWWPTPDDLSYHAPMAAFWIKAERLIVAPYSYQAYYPGNGELLSAWLMLPTRWEAPAFIAGAYWLLLACLSVAQLCRRLGCDAATSALAAALPLLGKPFLVQARTFSAVDLAVAAACAAALALAAPRAPADAAAQAAGRAESWLVGALVGTAVGCKVTAAPVALLIAIYFALARFAPHARARAALWLGAAAFTTGSAFYLRNLALTGNPFFPGTFLGLHGSLDAETLRRSSLAFQLSVVDAQRLAAAWKELLDWPRPLAWALLVAWVVSLILGVLPSFATPARRALLACLAGAVLLSLLVVAWGPFSGTVHSPRAQLNVRLRFFLTPALLCIPLLAHAAGRMRPALHSGPLVLGALVLGLMAKGPTMVLWLAAACAAGAVLCAWRPWRALPAGAAKLAPWLLCALVPWGLAIAMQVKQPIVTRSLRLATPQWRALDRVPKNARVTWYASRGHFKYYAAFGPRLRRTPIAVQRDGRPYFPLHEQPRYRAPWLPHISPPAAPRRGDDLAVLLRAQGIEYVMLMRPSDGQWPSLYHRLKVSKHARVIERTKTEALYYVGLEPGPP